MCQLDLDVFVKFTIQIGIALEKQWQGGNASHKEERAILMGKGEGGEGGRGGPTV